MQRQEATPIPPGRPGASGGTLNRITSPKSKKEDDPSDGEDTRTETSHLGST
ncbi:hypothetical protein K0M31_000129 [Melipona bicolor]|uniref:Uncharacterized protein n=1 Tax=Melipona bicolor TaxID=60889 RepID=A0AA40KWJ0_9HYME|nr:hypothetical protein K0M31_000129 [Melipona bicolor]